MAFASLQELGGIGGVGDVGTDDSSNDGSGIVSALENIGINFAAGAAQVGVNALATKSGAPPVYAPYSGSSLALRPGVNTAVGQQYLRQTSPNPNTTTYIVGGGFVLVTLLILAIALRK